MQICTDVSSEVFELLYCSALTNSVAVRETGAATWLTAVTVAVMQNVVDVISPGRCRL